MVCDQCLQSFDQLYVITVCLPSVYQLTVWYVITPCLRSLDQLYVITVRLPSVYQLTVWYVITLCLTLFGSTACYHRHSVLYYG